MYGRFSKAKPKLVSAIRPEGLEITMYCLDLPLSIASKKNISFETEAINRTSNKASFV